MSLIFQKLIPNAIKPELAIAGCGSIFTLYAPETTMLHPGIRNYIGTGIRIELPPNTILQLSSIGYGVDVELNGTYFITAGYRANEILVPLLNKESFPVEIKRGRSIAEFAILPLQPTSGLLERVATVEPKPPRAVKRAQAGRPRGRPRKQVKTSAD